MAAQPDLPAENSPPSDLSVDTALQTAWWLWFALSVIPFVLFLAVLWHSMDAEPRPDSRDVAERWFVAVMIYMAVGVPLAFFGRSRFFRGYWSGQCIKPRDYLAGMLTVWLAIEFGGIIALVGCLVSGLVLPNLLPALLAFMLFTPLWPSGHSMIAGLENERDPAHYQEPR